MAEQNYDKLLERISKSSGLDKDEIEKKVEAKRSKLAGLISKEGAAQIIASELGISFEKEKLKIDELVPGMKKVNLVGKIMKISPIRTFTTKTGVESKVVNLMVADETSMIKVVLWDTNHVGLIETGELFIEKVIEVSNGNMRDNELHLGSFSELKISNHLLENVKTEVIIREKIISGLRVQDNVKIRAFIVQTFGPKFFELCPQCKKRANSDGTNFVCAEHGIVTPDKRALLNLVLDDGTDNIRAVLFSDLFPSIGINDLEDAEKISYQREDLLGKEMIFQGVAKTNKFFNNLEFSIEKVDEVKLDELINKLEEKS